MRWTTATRRLPLAAQRIATAASRAATTMIPTPTGYAETYCASVVRILRTQRAASIPEQPMSTATPYENCLVLGGRMFFMHWCVWKLPFGVTNDRLK